MVGPLPAHAITKSQLMELEMKRSITARTGKPMTGAVRPEVRNDFISVATFEKTSLSL